LAGFVEVNGAPLLKTKDGTIVGIFPLDHVAWTSVFAVKERAVSEDIKKIAGVRGRNSGSEGPSILLLGARWRRRDGKSKRRSQRDC